MISLNTFHGSFRRLCQNGIDEELSTVISGFEALNKPRQAVQDDEVGWVDPDQTSRC